MFLNEYCVVVTKELFKIRWSYCLMPCILYVAILRDA